MKKYIYKSSIVMIMLTLVGIFYACKSDEDQTVGTPKITGVSPAGGGPVGTYVTITGTFFSPVADNNIVEFNGTKATIMSVTSSTITTTVPAGASTGPITVTVKGRSGASSSFNVSSGTPNPVIFGFTPTAAFSADGTEVTITGLNFSTTKANNVVSFSSVTDGVFINAPVPTEATATSLKVTIPAGARSGKIKVAVTGAASAATSEAALSVPAPTISSFTPTFSIEGATVIISGANFSPTAANNLVKFNGLATPALEASATSLTVKVPAGATTGDITVTVDGQTANGGEFNLPHTITSFTPLVSNAAPGDSVTITGTNFSATASKNVVKFAKAAGGTVTAGTPRKLSSNSLKVAVPATAITGKIYLTIGTETVASLLDFTVN